MAVPAPAGTCPRPAIQIRARQRTPHLFSIHCSLFSIHYLRYRLPRRFAPRNDKIGSACTGAPSGRALRSPADFLRPFFFPQSLCIVQAFACALRKRGSFCKNLSITILSAHTCLCIANPCGACVCAGFAQSARLLLCTTIIYPILSKREKKVRFPK